MNGESAYLIKQRPKQYRYRTNKYIKTARERIDMAGLFCDRMMEYQCGKKA